MVERFRRIGSYLPPVLLAVGSLILYIRTLAPSVATIFDDSLELQLVGPTLGIAHPTGYPLYTLLAYLCSRLLPLGDAAYRVNLLSAVMGSATVATLYLAAHELTQRRLAAFVAAAFFALTPVFWAQATLAEVYTLHTFFVACILWQTLHSARKPPYRWEGPIVLLGLSLTHHRMALLLVPALVVFILRHDAGLLRRVRAWPRLGLAFAAPLLLYAYLPLRGREITSLDGTYQNTWLGFWGWVTASGYNIFLTGNPFGVHYTPPFYADLFLDQFGAPGLALAAIGLLAAWRWRQRWLLPALALAANLIFALAYRAQDIEVFFLPTFLVLSFFIAAGVAALPRWAGHVIPTVRPAFQAMLAVIALAFPSYQARANFASLDRSQAWEVHDLGRDMLASVAQGGTVVGLLGEMTLLRYFQQTQGLRPDVATIAADDEAARRAAVAAALASGKAVYITRPLAGAPERYSLSVAGPLIRVWPKGAAQRPAWSQTVDVPFLDGRLRWLGYHMETLRFHRKTVVRLGLWWRVMKPPDAEYKFSVRLLADTPTEGSDGYLLAQTDDVPVHNTYPTTFWQAGEIVHDGYDLLLPAGALPSPLRLVVILYNPQTGAEVWRHEVFPVQ